MDGEPPAKTSSGAEKPAPWGHMLVALTTGICIVGLAYVSRRLVAEPISPVLLGVPPLLLGTYGMALRKYRGHPLMRPWVWALAIVTVSGLVALASWL